MSALPDMFFIVEAGHSKKKKVRSLPFLTVTHTTLNHQHHHSCRKKTRTWTKEF